MTSTTPADGAINVARNATVTAIFNTEVRCTTVTSSSFTVSEGGIPVTGTVNCTGLTAIFTPAANLSPATVYTATVQSSVRDLNNTPMEADRTWSFTTTASAGGPTVTATIPVTGATNVLTDATITATFSEEVRCSTVTAASFTLENGGTPVAGTVTCYGTSADFTPSSLLSPSTVYTTTVTSAVENLSGEPMAADHVWTFTTTPTPGGPQVSATSPVNGATGVLTDTTITATFSEEMRCSTITSASFTLADGGTPVAGSVTCAGTSAEFTPSSLLTPGTVYTATVTTAVENSAGDPMAADHTWNFTTTATPNGPRVNSTSPSGGATNVLTDTVITATFSEEVKCSTITGASFTLNDGSPVAGTVECFGMTAIFTPTTSMSLNTVYTGTITTAVENLDGVPMAANHAWSFTVEPGPSMEQKMRGIWVIGGAATIAGGTCIQEIDLYDPVTNTWYPDVAASATGDTYIPSAFGMAVYMSGKIYVMGGATDYATLTGRVQVYDIAANTWTTMTSIPLVRAGSVSYVQGGQAYILGGANSVTASGTAGVNTHYRFNPAGAGAWFTTHPTYTTTPTLAVMPTIRIGSSIFNFSGDVSYAGGMSATTTITYYTLNDIYQWINNAYTAQTEAALASNRSFMASYGYSGTNGTFFFMAGGVATVTRTSNNMFFNFSTMTYVPIASSFLVYLPPSTTAATGRLLGATCPSFTASTATGIAFHAGAVSPYNGSTAEDPTFYIFGGYKNRTATTTDVSAISANGTVTAAGTYTTTGWVSKASMPAARPRFGHSAVVAEP